MSIPARRRISFVVPCYDEEASLPLLHEALTALFERLEPRYEIEVVLVDDGSRDRTWSLIRDYAEKDPRFRGISLSRNFGHQAALSCGYDRASGDAVVSLDADLQDPPEVILEMIEKWEAGADVVYAVRESREGETAFKRGTAALFYRAIRALGAGHVRADAGDFRLLSRRALEALRSLPEYHRFVRGMVGWIGFRTDEVRFTRPPRRAGSTKYTLRKMLGFAIDAVVSFSIVPLRLAYLAGALLCVLILGYLGYALVRFLFFGGELEPGWTSLILAVIGFGTMNLVCLGILGEYVGRIYEQTKQRPVYLVKEASPPGSPPEGRG